MIYGYARVSSAMQARDGNSLEEQVSALEKYGCQNIVKEAFSAKTMERPQFQKLIENLKEGDLAFIQGRVARRLSNYQININSIKKQS